MAKKKKTQFKGAKYKDGILSYNYLGGKGGKGRGAVSIKKQGDDWFFVDDKGEIRDALGNGGKLTPTHINNLKRDGIFEAVKVNPDTGVEIKAGDSGDIDAQEVRMPRGGESDTSSFEQTANYQVAPQTDSASFGRGYGKYTYPGGEGTAVASAPVPVKQGGMGAQSEWADKGLKSEPTYYQGEAMGLEGQNFAPAQTWEGAGQISLPSQPINNVTSPQSLTGQNEFTGFGQENMSGPGWGAPSTPTVQRELGPTTSEWAAKGFASEPKYHQEGSVVDYGQHTRGPVSQAATDRLEAAAAPGVTVEKDNPWGAADWSAVGSVMKGVGGLASAYTGIKNYQLARDAFNTQKNQWQQDYDQRVKAFEQNRKLANQDIQSRNRTLLARNKDRTDTYSELKA